MRYNNFFKVRICQSCVYSCIHCKERCQSAVLNHGCAPAMATKHQKYHDKERLVSKGWVFGKWGLTLQLSEGGRRVILLLDCMGIRAGSQWSREGVQAAGRGRAEIKGWCSGLDHRPGAALFTSSSVLNSLWAAAGSQRRDWRKRVAQEEGFPPAPAY